MCVYLRTKFQVSSIVITIFRQGEFYTPSPQNEPLKNPPRLGLIKQHNFKVVGDWKKPTRLCKCKYQSSCPRADICSAKCRIQI